VFQVILKLEEMNYQLKNDTKNWNKFFRKKILENTFAKISEFVNQIKHEPNTFSKEKKMETYLEKTSKLFVSKMWNKIQKNQKSIFEKTFENYQNVFFQVNGIQKTHKTF
jgi:hypothetical protein